MVFLALTPAGLVEALRVRGNKANAVWCGSDAISEADYAALEDVNVSRFIYPLQWEASDVLAGAIDTIEQHHPGETVWVERCA
jgi:methylmalonyl-CoA mutase cobalamin-binding subunit